MNLYAHTEMFSLEDTHFWFVGKRLFIQRVLNSLKLKRLKIADIGSGTGGTTHFLSHWGRVTGIEKNPIAVTFAKQRNVKVIRATAHALPLPSSSHTLVTFFDVLYHKNVRETQALKEAYRVLKPGGYLLITDCAIPQLYSNHDSTMGAKYRYTKTTLSHFITNAGFSILRTQYIFTSVFPFFVFSRLFMPSEHIIQPPLFLNTLLIALLRAEATFPTISLLPGSSLLVLAQKPMRKKRL
jgi:ubiquinone/menaquinone biosynthesis C-methylase UbiE